MASEESLKALDTSDFLFHLASSTVPSTSNSNIVFDLESNVIATVSVLQAAVRQKVRHVVFVSSGGTVYGIPRRNPIDEAHPTDPICSYGIQKLAIEKYLQLFRTMKDLDSIVLRVSNMYGESQSPGGPVGAVTHFTDRALHGKPLEVWGDGGIIRDYVHVDDVAEALISSIAFRGSERLFNIGTGRGVSLKQLIEMIQARTGLEVRSEFKPPRGFDVSENVLDVSRARRELRWAPSITLEAGLDRMIERLRSVRLPSEVSVG
jgi:UDP-glucose 4-epimerase